MTPKNDDSPGVLYLRRVPRSLKRRIRIEAARRGVPVNDYAVDLLARCIEREEREVVKVP